MSRLVRSSTILSIIILSAMLVSAQGQTATKAKSASVSTAIQTPKPQQTAPAVNEWVDDFNGTQLDETKWERFTFEGGGGGKVEVKDGELRLRSANGTRAGVRSKPAFESDRFIVEAHVAKVGPQLPTAGDRAGDLGFAALTVLFDSSGRNRIEWILTSEGTL